VKSAPVTPSVPEQIFPGGRIKSAIKPLLLPHPEILEAVLERVDPQARDEVRARSVAFQEMIPDRCKAISKGHPGLDEWGIYRRLHAGWLLYVVGSPQGDPYSNRDAYDLLRWFPGKKAKIRKLSPKEEQETSEIFRRRLETTKAVEGARAFHQRLRRQPQGIQKTKTVCRYCRKFFTRSLRGKGSDGCPASDCKNHAEADRKRKSYQKIFGI
jgi:hypothetical protein